MNLLQRAGATRNSVLQQDVDRNNGAKVGRKEKYLPALSQHLNGATSPMHRIVRPCRGIKLQRKKIMLVGNAKQRASIPARNSVQVLCM